MGRDKAPAAPSSAKDEKGKKGKAAVAPASPPIFVPTPGEKLTREQHALLRAQRAKAFEEEKKSLFGASWTGKTPAQVLQDQCQRNGWDRPQISANKKGDRGWQGTVTLQTQDPKTRETLRFTTSDSQHHSATELECKQWASTYALHRFCSHLGVHRMLPPSHQDYWNRLEEVRKAAPDEVRRFDYAADPFAAVMERLKWEKEKEKNARDEAEREERERGKERESYQSVTLSAELRSAIETLIASTPSTKTSTSTAVTDTDRDSLLEELKKKGFRAAHCEEALQYNSDLTSALDWLCIYVPEDDLPPAFALDKAQAAEISGGQSSTAALNREWSVKRMIRTGFDRKTCGKAYDDNHASELLALSHLFRSACSTVPPPVGPSEFDSEELKSSWMEEISSLESIYCTRVQHVHQRNVVRIRLDDRYDSVLEVGFDDSRTSYPHELPAVIFESEKLPAYIKLSILKGLADEARGLLGMPMVFSLVGWVEENLERVVDAPVSLVDLMNARRGDVISTVAHQNGDTESFRGTKGSKKRGRRGADTTRGAEIIKRFKDGCECSDYKQMLKGRERLPSYAYRMKIIEALQTYQVIVICGETGCGKSTQTGQFILESVLSECDDPVTAGKLNIIVTQPRRISAMSLAARVAQERGESNPGGSVGYVVRGERVTSTHTVVTFLTTGVLLRMLQNDPELSEVTHVIVDEVHERSVDGDFLLVILRDLLTRRKDLKVILMSATIESELFSNYFGQCEVLQIPGFTHPVTDIYLDEILVATGHVLNSSGASGGAKKKKKEGVEKDIDDDDGGKAEYEALQLDPRSVRALLRESIDGPVDYELIASVVNHICKNEDASGAILIFLQGAMEIDRCIDTLKTQEFAGSLEIYPLHASLSSRDQGRVFARPRKGKRKVVVSTNIAETSITIDDVVFVIDAGRVKEMQYEDGTMALKETVASRASSKQRRGRAGRVRPGKCYKLFTRRFERMQQPAHSVPEILRVPLAQLCLTLKSMGVHDTRGFLGRAISAPPTANIDEALDVLQSLSAIDADGRLTALGCHMASLPADLRIAKMLIFGAVFGCIEPVLTIAALMSTKSPFVAPSDKRGEAMAVRNGYSWDRSDWLTDVRAYHAWVQASSGGRAAERDFCEKNFLSSVTLTMISDLREQYCDILADIGFVDKKNRPAGNINEKQSRIIKAAIVAGLYPQIATVKHPDTTYVDTAHGTVVREADPREIKFLTEKDGEVFLHPSSVNSSVTKFEDLLIVYVTMFNMSTPLNDLIGNRFHQKVITSKMFLRDSTMISPWPVLMFGGPLTVDHDDRTITIAGFTKMCAVPRIAVLVNGLRRLLDDILYKKVEDPRLDVAGSAVGKLLLRLLLSDGQ